MGNSIIMDPTYTAEQLRLHIKKLENDLQSQQHQVENLKTHGEEILNNILILKKNLSSSEKSLESSTEKLQTTKEALNKEYWENNTAITLANMRLFEIARELQDIKKAERALELKQFDALVKKFHSHSASDSSVANMDTLSGPPTPASHSSRSTHTSIDSNSSGLSNDSSASSHSSLTIVSGKVLTQESASDHEADKILIQTSPSFTATPITYIMNPTELTSSELYETSETNFPLSATIADGDEIKFSSEIATETSYGIFKASTIEEAQSALMKELDDPDRPFPAVFKMQILNSNTAIPSYITNDKRLAPYQQAFAKYNDTLAVIEATSKSLASPRLKP